MRDTTITRGKSRDNGDAHVDLNEDQGDEEAGEDTGLLGTSSKEEKRERIARIALNGQ
jgi:hypothetical protein